MLSLFEILKINNIDPNEVRLVRHSNKEIDACDTFINDPIKFNEYSAWQKPGKYRDAKHLVMFCPARGTTSLFLGVWEITGITENKKLTESHLELLKQFDLPEKWHENHVRYDIKLTNIMSELSQRLIIEWGGSTVSWVQSIDKQIVQIKPQNSIGDFTSYDSILLSYQDLSRLIQDKDSNISWINALSSVNGVYLIKNKIDGRLYVGSAYGKEGILGRWTTYANNGHAGNKLLKNLNPHNFEFSILEISPSTMSAEDVIARENRWKECLGTRQFGLNSN